MRASSPPSHAASVLCAGGESNPCLSLLSFSLRASFCRHSGQLGGPARAWPLVRHCVPEPLTGPPFRRPTGWQRGTKRKRSGTILDFDPLVSLGEPTNGDDTDA